jgi:hypothetical protein
VLVEEDDAIGNGLLVFPGIEEDPGMTRVKDLRQPGIVTAAQDGIEFLAEPVPKAPVAFPIPANSGREARNSTMCRPFGNAIVKRSPYAPRWSPSPFRFSVRRVKVHRTKAKLWLPLQRKD